MSLKVGELKNKLEQYSQNKKIRVLFGVSHPILWLSHEFNNDLIEGCVLVTSEELEKDIHLFDRIDTVGELLWNLQFFKEDLSVMNNDLECCQSSIEEVVDGREVKDLDGEFVEDTVFLVNLAHIVG